LAGEYTDSESGQQYLHARYYDPSAGQFISRDPAVAATREPYAYTIDSPLNGSDPSGLGGPNWGAGWNALVGGAKDLGRTLTDRARTGAAKAAAAGSSAYDSGQIDAFQLDDVIHQYKRGAQELWKFCTVSGAEVERAVRALELRKAEDEEPDWWEIGATRRR
jgi:RHS repeat-associated protein